LVRHRRSRGGPDRGRGQSRGGRGDDLNRAEVSLLRPALETAVIVARAGESSDPRQAAPPSLRAFFRFQKLPSRALVVARRAIDDDDAFRTRVRDAVAADPDLVGEAGWLLLDRPDGWEVDLADLIAAAGRADEERDARKLARVLEQARAALARSEATASEIRRERDQLSALLEAERAARAELDERVAVQGAQLEQATAERATAIRELKDFEARLAVRTDELRDATSRIAELERAPSPANLAAAPRGVDDAVEPAIDGVALARVLAEARAASDQLAAAIARAVELSGEPEATAAPNARAGRPRRRPAAVPRGMFDDTPEAAAHFLRLPAAIVLVDGYNVAMRGWPGQELRAQRDRLVGALAGVCARTGADSVVVFDGADVAPVAGRAGHRHVQVRFSPEGVEADDVVLALIDEVPADAPVIVVSDDRRVRDGARSRGANVVGVDQLLALI
jgi:predicted RNA-binding protein with PIN domain